MWCMDAEDTLQRALVCQISRGEAIKRGGIGVLGLAFGLPLISTIHPRPGLIIPPARPTETPTSPPPPQPDLVVTKTVGTNGICAPVDCSLREAIGRSTPATSSPYLLGFTP